MELVSPEEKHYENPFLSNAAFNPSELSHIAPIKSSGDLPTRTFFNIPKASKPIDPSLLPRKHRSTTYREKEQKRYEESLKK